MHARATLIGTIAVSAGFLIPTARADSPYDWPGGIHRPSASALAAAQESTIATPTDASTPTVVAGARANGFDWGDAVVGAAVGIAASLLLLGCAVLLVSERGRTRPA